jgi:ribose transport system ATP-binding protein
MAGAPYRPRSIAAAKRFGVGYIPAERKTEGLFLNQAVDINVAAASLGKVSRMGLFRGSAARATAQRYVEALRIRARDVGEPCGALSGGNQQKVLFAKWIETAPKLLVIEEPTKGVDIAAKADIHREMLALAAKGAAILFVSSDLPEILAIAHRVLVMHHGRLVAALDAAEATEQNVTALASGLSRAAA